MEKTKSQSKLFEKKFKQKSRKWKVPRLVIRFNIKKALPKETRVGSKIPESLDKLISDTLKKAAERAKANNRTTILPQDL